jgi:hypothetical protein
MKQKMFNPKIDDSELRDLKQEWDQRRHAQGNAEPPTDLAEVTVEFRRRDLQARRNLVPRDIQRYTNFQSDKPRLNYTFLYPDSWLVREFEDTGHTEVLILGPRNFEDTLNLAIFVHAFPGRESGGKYATLDQVVSAFQQKHARLLSFNRRPLTRGFLGEVEAVEIEIGYALALPPNQSNVPSISVTERRIIFRREVCFYELGYIAAETDYYIYFHVFREITRTFEFRSTVKVTAFYPLVAPAPMSPVPALALAEKREDYVTRK